MTFPPRSRADAFAAALLGAEDAGAPDGVSPDLARLVTLARALPVPETSMAPEVRDRMRRRLVAMAAVSATASPDAGRPARAGERRSLGHWLGQRRTVAAAGMIVVLLLILGVGSAARDALPGDPLYRVKTATEAIRLATTSGKVARGERHLAMASERLTEVQQLLARDKTSVRGLGLGAGMPLAAAPGSDATPPRVWTALVEMSDQTVAGTKDLTEAWKASGSTGPLNTLSNYARAKFPVLQRTIASLPRDDQRAAGRSLNVLVLIADRAATLQSLGGRCDADCRSGHPKGSQLAIAVDPLGAVACVAGCKPAASVSELAVPNPPAGTPAAAMQAALTAWEVSLPSVAESNATPAALLSLPAIPSAPSPSPPSPSASTTAPGAPGNPTSPPTPESPSPPPVEPTTPAPDLTVPGPTSPDKTAPTPSDSPTQTPPPTPAPSLTPTPAPSDTPSPSDSPSSVSSSAAMTTDTASPSDSPSGDPASAGLSQSPSPDPAATGKPSPSTPSAASAPDS